MWFFYLFALVPIVIGFILVWQKKEIDIKEWLLGSGAAILLAIVFHLVACNGMTRDVQTLSGKIISANHYPQWVECYQQSHSSTDSKGNTTTWITTEYETHYEKWSVNRNFGSKDDEENINESLYNQIKNKFGGKIERKGTQTGDHLGYKFSGDDSIYTTENQTGYIYPVTKTTTFTNKIKAAPTVFSFPKVPTNINVYEWPRNNDWMNSGRLLGTAAIFFDNYKFDCLNSELGPLKKVNLIIVGFGNKEEEIAHYQQAKWIGGKKNDLVICFSGSKGKPANWCYVFGWTEKEIVKQNIQTIFLNNAVNNDILPLLAVEIKKNYIIKDWNKFSYITITPPTWSYYLYLILLTVTQIALYIWFNHADVFGDFNGRYYHPQRSFGSYRN